ncbi:MAG: formate--tetrahydrofolate ligase [Pirellulales bacterium]|jgi:formate--tetrahydrofolate ligase|nr:formate--tetrahydrofolate ligase [Thermoguttaceae bacterium]MDD4787572.1 formate--tetrahydrofolate ligase [Pirellulales bacterium]MDI9444810.1 formate--tetrahydrofolate ligase [Planctomycetota bacterium]
MPSNLPEVPAAIEIARRASLRPITEIAAELNIPADDLELYGKYKAKVSLDLFHRLAGAAGGKLILVTAITPTPAGEGKTTTSIGLADALRRAGKTAAVCLREPSMGPCFGMKGGAAGGGYSQVVPMEDINLHFTGDIHAIELAHNLLAAILDNHIHHGNRLGLDVRRLQWGRVVDMNDRALRSVTVGLGGPNNGVPRESTFDITVASEVMAILCLSESLTELKHRLGRIVVGQTGDRKPVTAADLKVHGAMAVLLKDAIKPNLVQTLEHTPAFVHGGPFANIAHGCNSVIATKLAMRLAEYTVTEAGFGADLGAEKFMNIKCRSAGISPAAVVIVATVRALKHHGGVALKDLTRPNSEALDKGVENLKKHIENVHRFGLPVVVAINSFLSDTDEEIQFIKDKCAYLGVEILRAEHWARGGSGAEALARAVIRVAENTKTDFTLLYPNTCTLWDKVGIICREIYGATEVLADKKLRAKFHQLQEAGYGELPICMAKTQYSLSTDPGLKGRPKKFDVPLRDVRVAAGAGYVVVLTGDIMTMPGLPKTPAAEMIDINEDEEIVGLF